MEKETINLHYSLLPKHRGVYPINWAIKNLDNETGVTLHKVTRDIDGGDILIQQSLPIEFDDDTESLLTKMDRMALELFKEVWKKRENWNNMFYPQEGVSSYHSRNDFNSMLNMDLEKLSAIELIKIIKATTFRGTNMLNIRHKNINYNIHINLEKE